MFRKGTPEKTLQLIDLYIAKNNEVPILVEGSKDLGALRRIGFKGKIITFNSGASIVLFAEEIAKSHKRVIVLFDFDRTGSFLRRRIISILTPLISEVDSTLWVYVRENLPVRTVEELPSILETLQEAAGTGVTRRKTRQRK